MVEINLEDPSTMRTSVEELCRGIRAKLDPLRKELNELPEKRAAATRDADVATIKTLKAREAEIHEQLFEIAAQSQKTLSLETQKLEDMLASHVDRLTKDSERCVAARTKLINDYAEALPKANEAVEKAELRHARFLAALGTANDMSFDLNRELDALIHESSAGIAA